MDKKIKELRRQVEKYRDRAKEREEEMLGSEAEAAQYWRGRYEVLTKVLQNIRKTFGLDEDQTPTRYYNYWFTTREGGYFQPLLIKPKQPVISQLTNPDNEVFVGRKNNLKKRTILELSNGQRMLVFALLFPGDLIWDSQLQDFDHLPGRIEELNNQFRKENDHLHKLFNQTPREDVS